MRLLAVSSRTLMAATFLVALVIAAIAGSKVSIVAAEQDFGFVYGGEHGLAEQQTLLVTAVGSQQVFSYAVASKVGGVILQAVGEPKGGIKGLTIAYDATAADGRRFKASMGSDKADIAAYDWQIVPLIRFVDSPYTAAMTLLGRPKTTTEFFRAGTMFIEIHPALRDTVIGNNFIFTDAMLVEGRPDKIRRVTERLSEPVPGYSDISTFDEVQSAAASSRITRLLRAGGWDSYIFTDVDVKFSFAIQNNQLDVTGDPYYAFVSLDEDDETSELNRTLTERLRGSRTVNTLNPKIYELDRKLFRLAAVLRYLKKEDGTAWSNLVKSVGSISVEPSMTTPRAWKQ